MRIRHTFKLDHDRRRAAWWWVNIEQVKGAVYPPRRNPAKCPKAGRADCKRILFANGERAFAYMLARWRKQCKAWADAQEVKRLRRLERFRRNHTPGVTQYPCR